MATKAKYKNVTAKIQKSRNKEDFDNGNYQPSEGGIYTSLKKAIQILENSNGGILEVYSARSLFLGNFGVSYKKEDNSWLVSTLNKKGIEVL